jgi:hypothetical protein
VIGDPGEHCTAIQEFPRFADVRIPISSRMFSINNDGTRVPDFVAGFERKLDSSGDKKGV